MIEGIKGLLGDGKTIYGVNEVLHYKYVRGRRVHTNAHIIGHKGIGDIESLFAFAKIRGSFVFGDDWIAEMDSRWAGRNVLLSHKMLQFRHYGNDFLYSFQVMSGSDLRLRQITDKFILIENVGFPMFKVVEVSTDGIPLCQPYFIEFDKEVYESFDTEQDVIKRISMDSLMRLYRECGIKGIFASVLNTRYNIDKGVLRDIYEMLQYEKYCFVKETLDWNGLEVVDLDKWLDVKNDGEE